MASSAGWCGPRLIPRGCSCGRPGTERHGRDGHLALSLSPLKAIREALGRPPPAAGADTDAILQELGYAPDDVARLHPEGVAGGPEWGR